MDVVYPELKRMARHKLAQEPHRGGLQTTSLVNETCLRLLKQDRVRWTSQRQLYGVAALLMRRILVDQARARRLPLTLQDAHMIGGGQDLDVLGLHMALEKLESKDPRKAKVVELRCYGGLRLTEIARLLDVSVATIERDWRFACAWIRHELEPSKLGRATEARRRSRRPR